jgi:hypothetical protein
MKALNAKAEIMRISEAVRRELLLLVVSVHVLLGIFCHDPVESAPRREFFHLIGEPKRKDNVLPSPSKVEAVIKSGSLGEMTWARSGSRMETA